MNNRSTQSRPRALLLGCSRLTPVLSSLGLEKPAWQRHPGPLAPPSHGSFFVHTVPGLQDTHQMGLGLPYSSGLSLLPLQRPRFPVRSPAYV